MEIERKWLVDKDTVLPLLKRGVMIEQHYLNTIEDKWLVRARRMDSSYFLTLKSRGLMSREELEFKISEDDYEKAIIHSVKSICKRRYELILMTDNAVLVEIDVFENYDFIICEVEFDSEAEALEFIPPTWCVKEVTNDPYYSNINLAK